MLKCTNFPVRTLGVNPKQEKAWQQMKKSPKCRRTFTPSRETVDREKVHLQHWSMIPSEPELSDCSNSAKRNSSGRNLKKQTSHDVRRTMRNEVKMPSTRLEESDWMYKFVGVMLNINLAIRDERERLAQS